MGKKAKAHEDRLLLKLRSGEVSPTQRFCDVCSRSDQYTLNTLFEKANPMISDRYCEIVRALADAEQLEFEIDENDPPHELPENFYREAADEIESAKKAFDDFDKMPIVEIYATVLGVPGLEELQSAIKGGQKKDKAEAQIDSALLKSDLKQLGEQIKKGFDATRDDFANLGDTMCEIIGAERIPPKPNKVDDMSRRKLYDLAKRITAKRGDLDTFLTKTTWTFRGFTAREIYKDADGLRRFIGTQRMWNVRHQE